MKTAITHSTNRLNGCLGNYLNGPVSKNVSSKWRMLLKPLKAFSTKDSPGLSEHFQGHVLSSDVAKLVVVTDTHAADSANV